MCQPRHTTLAPTLASIHQPVTSWNSGKMIIEPHAAPVLSTPDTHILNGVEPVTIHPSSAHLSDEAFDFQYEITRTIQEIKENKWNRVALQFPDEMLPDSARVYQRLARGLKLKPHSGEARPDDGEGHRHDTASILGHESGISPEGPVNPVNLVRLTILADTSYGSCCVDEIAAEHVDAEVVIHYGRACLSPTARLPVVHVFTKQELDYNQVIGSFRQSFPDFQSQVIVTADMPYAHHVSNICAELQREGYTSIYAASLVHDPSSLIPNRTIPEAVRKDASKIKDWNVFHISEPPTSLLLTLSSRIASTRIYPTHGVSGTRTPRTTESATSQILRRRYALVTSLATVSIWGILINTLSVKNYLHVVDHVRSQIAAAGKKSYLFVVGKLNAAKVANFSEIGGWVVIGCWETSLVDSKDFYKPIITPFELELALRRDRDRLWTGEWRADFEGILDTTNEPPGPDDPSMDDHGERSGDWDSEEESAPPEFDLRTGRYVSHTRPLRPRTVRAGDQAERSTTTTALARRAHGDVVTAVNGVPSPAAAFLKTQRTWRGLGTDFDESMTTAAAEEEEGGSAIEEGRSGVARGYTVGESTRH